VKFAAPLVSVIVPAANKSREFSGKLETSVLQSVSHLLACPAFAWPEFAGSFPVVVARRLTAQQQSQPPEWKGTRNCKKGNAPKQPEPLPLPPKHVRDYTRRSGIFLRYSLSINEIYAAALAALSKFHARHYAFPNSRLQERTSMYISRRTVFLAPAADSPAL
jgi:hypothetical protein